MIYVDFIFVDFKKILDKFIYLLGNYFLPTLPCKYDSLHVVFLGGIGIILYNFLVAFYGDKHHMSIVFFPLI